MPRRAFTLLELLMVIMIIMILAAILIPSIVLLLNRQKKMNTEVRVDSLKLAIDHYMARNATFGFTDAVGNVLDPLWHLHRALPAADRHLDLTAPICVKDVSGTLDGPWDNALPAEATHMRDGFNGPILIQVHLEQMPGLSDFHARYILVRSEGRDVGPQALHDDLVVRLDTKDGSWKEVRMAAIGVDGKWVIEDN